VLSAEESKVSGVERFIDLKAWQKARVLTRAVYGITRQGAFAQDFGLRNQMQRASVSIMSNIAEGFERAGHGEFQQFLSIAKASCAEVHSLLYVAYDAAYIDQATFDAMVGQAEEVGRIVGGLRAAVERRRRQAI
jgi:four helix bundle protein